ncbi:MAG TPA: M56 family metallopeptidase, partial [Gemmataceae bacterium]|nr:M56 family metallopeptidase [Gemmataceae bacterium]
AINIIRFRRLLRHARPAPSQLQQTVQRLAQRLGLKNVPSVWLVPGAVSPMVWAVGLAPRLLFPSKLLDRLDDEQRRTLLAHELAHVRRRDHWVRLLELLVTSLYWWHPIVWWARREIHEAEEHCCDAWVVSTLDGAERTYALALLQVLAFVSKARAVLPATASGIGQVPHLRRRLTMICQTKTPRSLSWTSWAALCGMGLLLLPILPTRAQQPPAEDSPPQQDQAEQQRIEKAVRRALEYLQQEQQAQPTKAMTKPKKNSKAIEQARAELEKARASFEQARAQLEKAQARLAKLEGRHYTPTGSAFFYQPVQVSGEKPRRVWVVQSEANGKPQVRAVEVPEGAKPGKVQAYGYSVIQAKPSTKPPQVQRYEYRIIGQPPANKGGGSVEERLERLQQDIEQLRQELKGHKTSGGSAPQLRWRVVPAAPATSTAPRAVPPPPAPVSVSRAAPAAPVAASSALPAPGVVAVPVTAAGAAPAAALPAPAVRPSSALPAPVRSTTAKP